MVGWSMFERLCLVCACALQVLKGIMTDEIKEKVGASLLLLKGNLTWRSILINSTKAIIHELYSHEDKANKVRYFYKVCF